MTKDENELYELDETLSDVLIARHRMSKGEMRFLRREQINSILHTRAIYPKFYWRLSQITIAVRFYERNFYGHELKAYR